MFVVVLSAVVVCLSVLLLLFVRFVRVLRVSFDAAKSVHVAAAVLCQREL